jgi:hypothetical protein
MTKPLEQLTAVDFLPLIGSRFTVVQNEGDLSLELIEVRPLPAHAHRVAPFALLFRGPRQPALAQRIHTLANAGFGPLSVFLVPVSGGGDGVDYEAVFN